jgi:integrase
MSLTGARPAEVHGIRVRTDGGQVTITIRGAKTDECRGVESRTLAYDREDLRGTAHGRAIIAFLGGREQRTVAVHGTEDSFRQRYQRAAERAGLTDTSAYTARHAARRELSERGVSQGEIAERLGHRDVRSQRAYG